MFTIYTHTGIFHADDVMAVAILRVLYPDAPVERVREVPESIGEEDVVIDIGGLKEPPYRFDHHQGGLPPRLADPRLEEGGCPYAAAGLVWSCYGPRVVFKVVTEEILSEEEDLTDRLETFTDQRVDRDLIQGIDALDTGSTSHLPKGGQVQPMSISHILSSFNPTWVEEDMDRDESFEEAVDVAITILRRSICRAYAVEAARQKVMEGITFAQGRAGGYNLERAFLREDARVLVLDEYVPWQEHIFERPDQENILYVVYPSLRGGWMAQQVPVEPGSFQGRKPFPSFWAGKRGWALGEAAGVICGDGPEVFCHPGRFILGTGDKQTTIQLACMACRHLE